MPRGYIEYLDNKFKKGEKKMIEDINDKMIRLIEETTSWHKETFPETTEDSQILKLSEETKELKEAAINGDMEKVRGETIDVLIVSSVLKERYNSAIGDIMFVAMMDKVVSEEDYNDVLNLWEKKLEININRKWIFENGVYHHVGDTE